MGGDTASAYSHDDAPKNAWNMPTKNSFQQACPQTKDTKPSLVRRRLDFDAPFYNEDYYTRNSGSSSSPVNQRTFKPPEPRD